MAVMQPSGKPLSWEAPVFKPSSLVVPECRPFSSEAKEFKPMSMDAPEFMPGGLSLSATAVEFVPTWARHTGFTSPAPVCTGQNGNMFMLDMDQYSDFSEDEASCSTRDIDETSSRDPASGEASPHSQKLLPRKPFPRAEADDKLATAGEISTLWRMQDISEPEQEQGVAMQKQGAVEQSITTPKLTQGSGASTSRTASGQPDAVEDCTEDRDTEGIVVVDNFDSIHKGETFCENIDMDESSKMDDFTERLSVSEPDAEASADDLDASQLSETEGKSDENRVSTSFCVNQMLLWRSAAMDLMDPKVVYSTSMEHTVATASKPKAGGKKGSRAPASSGVSATWRGELEKGAPQHDEAKQPSKFDASDSSWLVQQRTRRNSTLSEGGLSDEDIVRSMKSILNKLTIEKFSQLYAQLISCGIKTVTHVELLIEEIFEKAITQHHFIDMYADLCAHLHEHFVVNPIVTDDPKKNFKKLLLNACQMSFERNLTPPQGLASLDEEERTLAEVKYKTRMLGNIRFVGALLTRKMLASKVLLAIMDELLSDPTPEALESLAVLLTAVGPTFDGPGWSYHVALNAIFEQVKKIIKQASTEPRVKCLLKDVLDIRAAGWRDRKPKKIEGPTTLGAVAQKKAQEEGAPMPQKIASASPCDGWEHVPSRGSRTPVVTSSPAEKASPNATVSPKEKVASKSAPKVKTKFDRQEYHREVDKTLRELRISHDVKDATARLVDVTPPLEEQPAELCDLLGRIVEEGSIEVRTAGFEVVSNLYLKGHWKSEIRSGLRLFVLEACPDLKHDVPALSQILREELHPGLARLVKRGLLSASKHDMLLQEI